jgi:hypothetical protein
MKKFKNRTKNKTDHKLAVIILLCFFLMPIREANAQIPVIDVVANSTWYPAIVLGLANIIYTLTSPDPTYLGVGTMVYNMDAGFSDVVSAIKILSTQGLPRAVGQPIIDANRIDTVGGRDADLLGQASVAPNSISCQTVRAAQIAGAAASASRGAAINLTNLAMNEARNPASPLPTSLKWKSTKLCALWCEGFISTTEYNGISFNQCQCF